MATDPIILFINGENMKYVAAFFCMQIIFLLCHALGKPAFAQNTNNKNNPISEYEDCSDTSVTVEKSKGPLTKEERIALMEKAFFSSLNKFDRCQTDTTSADNSASSDTESASSGDQNGGASGLAGQTATSNASYNPVASKEISGSDEQVPTAATEDSGLNVQEKGAPFQEKGITLANGKTPEDIPPAQNDSILEAQIRTAAETETDPVKKAKLWNEYRRYKGLEIIKGTDDN